MDYDAFINAKRPRKDRIVFAAKVCMLLRLEPFFILTQIAGLPRVNNHNVVFFTLDGYRTNFSIRIGHGNTLRLADEVCIKNICFRNGVFSSVGAGVYDAVGGRGSRQFGKELATPDEARAILGLSRC